MSDYVHNKVVRLPFPKELLQKLDTDDVWDCEKYLEELDSELWNRKNKKHFEIECTDECYYIDWVYYHTYGDESGDWGNVRLLTEKELATIKPYFDKLSINYKDEDLRLVDYCYYNCSEAPDYYKIKDDESDAFLN